MYFNAELTASLPEMPERFIGNNQVANAGRHIFANIQEASPPDIRLTELESLP